MPSSQQVCDTSSGARRTFTIRHAVSSWSSPPSWARGSREARLDLEQARACAGLRRDARAAAVRQGRVASSATATPSACGHTCVSAGRPVTTASAPNKPTAGLRVCHGGATGGRAAASRGKAPLQTRQCDVWTPADGREFCWQSEARGLLPPPRCVPASPDMRSPHWRAGPALCVIYMIHILTHLILLQVYILMLGSYKQPSRASRRLTRASPLPRHCARKRPAETT
jgi:hypothetical protein